MKFIKYFRIWIEDSVEAEGGFWCYMGMDEENFLWELNENRESYMADKVNATLEMWIEWEYKIEEL
jgi:hypothetical protein